MSLPPRSASQPVPLSRSDRWRQTWLVVLVAALVVLTVVAVGRSSPGPAGNAAAAASRPGATGAEAAPSPRAPVTDAPSVPRQSSDPVPMAGSSTGPALPDAPLPQMSSPEPPSASAGSPFPAEGVLRLDGPVPVKGSGDFEFANEHGPVAGSQGTVRRFRVAVEKGSGEDVAAFAAQVRAILSDTRSWIGDGRVRLQMVSGAEQADFTVYLATRDTAGRMCERGGTNIRIGGVPYTSCRTTGKAIINLDRWRGSASTYLRAGAGLAAYRQYVINHEVGHELGHRHEGCPKAGGPAPVMVQQTLTLRGCVPYSWPRHDGTGPVAPGL